VSASVFMRVSGAILSQIEVGVGSAEQASRWGFSRKSIREMEAAIEDVRSQQFAAASKRDRAVSERAAQLVLATTWGENAAYALSKERRDLAEQAIGRQLDAECEAKAAAEREHELTMEAERLASLVTELTAERKRMVAELAAFERSQPIAPNERKQEDTAEQRFDRARARFDRLMDDERSARSDAAENADMHEIDKLRRADQVSERLAALQSDAGSRG